MYIWLGTPQKNRIKKIYPKKPKKTYKKVCYSSEHQNKWQSAMFILYTYIHTYIYIYIYLIHGYQVYKYAYYMYIHIDRGLQNNWESSYGFQWFSSSELVQKSVENHRWASPNYFAIGSTVWYTNINIINHNFKKVCVLTTI